VGESGREGVPAHGFMLDEPAELCEAVDRFNRETLISPPQRISE
jgi:hypothetical protein